MENGDMQIDPKLLCTVCGENKFGLREGFYYCVECGTKQDQVRAIEVDREDEFNNSKHLKKQKIKLFKAEIPELTSWECYNYILRGYVEELLSMGAKEELKLMTLQVWAAYLKRLEVAFFNKKHAELPKLGVRFLKRDAKALYNHTQNRIKKRRRRSNESSLKSGESNQREWRKNKRKLDESEYSFQTASKSQQSKESDSQYTSNTSTTTAGTTRAIQLKFTSLARKQFKKIMPIKHLQKHEKDSEGNLECHKSKPKVRSLKRFDYTVTNLNIKQIYTILAIALNLVEDDIELVDLVRYINEGRLSTTNVGEFFPENILPHYKGLLTEIEFFSQTNKFTYKALRTQTADLAKFLCISEFRKPDINRLAKRYVTELNLPDDVAIFVERLINLLPPQLETRATFAYPAYEARAMAYIIFVLKLLFGLDGHKEQLISDSAARINSYISDIKTAEDKQKFLFVWNDWMEYVEMRKVIIAQYNRNFSHQNNQSQSTAQLIAELDDEQQHVQKNINPDDATEKRSFKSHGTMFANMKKIFEEILQDYDKAKPETVYAISFPPSYTPAHSYFKRILLHNSTLKKDSLTASVKIPEFMRTDHTQRVMRCFLQPKPLSEFFQSKGLQFEILKAPCSRKRQFVGIFRSPLEPKVINTLVQADFNITDEEWLENIKNKPQRKELEFKTEFVSYTGKHLNRMKAASKKRKTNVLESEWKNIIEKSKQVVDNIKAKDFLLPASEFGKKLNACISKDNDDLMSFYSIDVFNENDMEPIENVSLTEPRRCFDGVSLFDNVSSAEESSSDDENETETPQHILATQSDDTLKELLALKDNDPKKLTFITSNLDYWTLIGYIITLNDAQKKMLERKFSRSFFWLLQTCAQAIGVDWSLVYEQLLIIEIMFVYGIESLDKFKDLIEFKDNLEVKDLNHLILMFREIW